MKKLFLLVCLSIMFGFSAFGQTSNNDLEQLRKELGLPVSVSISKSNVALSNSTPIKIFLAIKHNKSALKNFISWVDEWNKTNGHQYGQLQIVNNLPDADIAAVQYQFGTTRFVREDSVQIKAGKLPPQDQRNDKIVLGKIGNSSVSAESSAKSLRIPLYTYLIARGKNTAWFVGYSRVDELISNENPFPDKLLQSAIETKLKNR